MLLVFVTCLDHCEIVSTFDIEALQFLLLEPFEQVRVVGARDFVLTIERLAFCGIRIEVLAPLPQVLLIVDAISLHSAADNGLQVDVFREFNCIKCGATIAMSGNIKTLACAEGLILACVVLASGPQVAVLLRAIDLLRFPAFWHAKLEGVVLILLSIMTAVSEMAVEHVATCVDFSILRGHGCEMLAAS